MLKFLGVGSCFNVKMGNTAAYYIEGEKFTLIDCGESVFEKIVSEDLLEGIKQVDIYITHLHSDHVGSLPSFIFYLKFGFSIKPNIYFPNDEIVQFLRLSNVSDEIYNFVKLENKQENVHVVKQKHTIVESAFGYIMKIGDKWIFYSGDANSYNLKWRRAFNGFYLEDKNIVVSHIYHDVTRHLNDAHVNIWELAKQFPRDIRKKVTLMHFDDEETIKIAKAHSFKIAQLANNINRK